VKPYSDDVINLWHETHREKHLDLPHFLLTLYDVWVYKDWRLRHLLCPGFLSITSLCLLW